LLGLIGLAIAALALAAAVNWAGNFGWRIGAGERPIESLAVLPLENLSRDPAREYFSDGMTDALITQLSKAGTLRVISRTSSIGYKGTTKSRPQIARELNVDGVIACSVLRSGNRVRIAVELIRRTDQHLWAETYDRDLDDILRLQSEVAEAVVQQVRTQLTTTQQARVRPLAIRARGSLIEPCTNFSGLSIYHSATRIPPRAWRTPTPHWVSTHRRKALLANSSANRSSATLHRM
jgi:TolB-like protein